MSNPSIQQQVWESRYRYPDSSEETLDDSWRRVAQALASAEVEDQGIWEERFFETLSSLQFLPGGRIIAGAGTNEATTLCNCFVLGDFGSTTTELYAALGEAALTLQYGGGIGFDLSDVAPQSDQRNLAGKYFGGPIRLLHLLDQVSSSATHPHARPGAMMATLRCNHPDIQKFITAKRNGDTLRRFNLSVLITDDFMAAVEGDTDWKLVFPTRPRDRVSAKERQHPTVHAKVRARELWDLLVGSAHSSAEPGVIFVDRINRLNNLWYREHLEATNPCGEVPLPPYGACTLGSINLSRFVRDPFKKQARLDLKLMTSTVETGVRMLDNAIQISSFPLPRQKQQAHGSRRIGLGVTGLADALIMLNLTYGSVAAREMVGELMKFVCETAYATSIQLARTRGAFPYLDTEQYLQGEFIQRLPPSLREAIKAHGIRNSHLLAIAPCGSISLLAGNLSTGIEPAFAATYTRHIHDSDGVHYRRREVDYAVSLWRSMSKSKPFPPAFVASHDLDLEAHLRMQATVQAYVDNAIAKTINLPIDSTPDRVAEAYSRAYALGLKGCTVFRSGARGPAVLEADTEASRCQGETATTEW